MNETDFRFKIPYTNRTLGQTGLLVMIGLGVLIYYTVFPKTANAMSVKCIKADSNRIESCNIQIYDAVLSGNSGSIVRLNFSDGYQVEAFCVDEENKNCLVRKSGDDQWETGRIDWINRPNFTAAFWIKTNSGKTLGIYDAPPSY